MNELKSLAAFPNWLEYTDDKDMLMRLKVYRLKKTREKRKKEERNGIQINQKR